MLNGKFSGQIQHPSKRMTITAVTGFNSAATNRIFNVSPSVQEALKLLLGFFLFSHDGMTRKYHCRHQHLSDHGIAENLASKPSIATALQKACVKCYRSP